MPIVPKNMPAATTKLFEDHQKRLAKKQATIRTAKQYAQEEKVETKPKFGQVELQGDEI